jgi:hypothetical protein
LLLALKAGIHQKIAASSGAEELCEKIADTFSENYFLEQEAAECIVRLLWSLIHKKPFSLPKPPVWSLTAKNAGIYTNWRKQKPPAVPAGKTARYKAGDFIHIDGVTFTAGSMEPYVDRNIRKVTLDPFSIMNRPVSQLEYWELLGDSPSYQQGDCLPVDGVNWYQAVEFCNLKNRKEGLDNVYTVDKKNHDPNNTDPADPFRFTVSWDRGKRGFRLPTAPEWEYASQFFDVENNLLEWCWDKLAADASCHLCGGMTTDDYGKPKIGFTERWAYGDGVCMNVNKNKSNLGTPCYSWSGPTGLRLVWEDK